MAAGVYNITIEQGATFTRSLTIKDGSGAALDITGWTFRGQIRSNHNSPTALASFTFTMVSPANGAVDVSLTDTETALLPGGRRCVYDIEAVKADLTVLRVLQGTATISPETTK